MRTLEEYHTQVALLGEALSRQLPKYHWEFVKQANIWLTRKPKEIYRLQKMFEYKDDWKAFIGNQSLIVLHMNDDWFGFTLD